MQLAPGSTRSPDLQRLRDEIAQRWRGLCGPPPFPVLEPHVVDRGSGRPAFLAERHRPGTRTPSILVCAGDPASASGPFIAVRSSPLCDAEPPPEPYDLLVEERDRLYDQAGIEEEEPGEEPASTEAVLVVDVSRLPVIVHRQAVLWATVATCDTPSGAILTTVVARGVPIEAVHLHSVDDLTGLVEAGAEAAANLIEHLTELATDAHPPEEWDLPPVHGTQAHVALIAHVLAEEATTAGNGLSLPAHHPHRQPARLREAAIRAQMSLAAQEREQATHTVASLANHVRELGSLSWFTDPTLREMAIMETVDWVTSAADVSSRTAQEAWESWHGARGASAFQGSHHELDYLSADDPWLSDSSRPLDPSDMQLMRARAEIEQMNRFEWRSAWQRWAEGGSREG